jgi:hypothetical protein
MPTDDWSTEETDDALYADQRNFYEVERWSGMGSELGCCGSGPSPNMAI